MTALIEIMTACCRVGLRVFGSVLGIVVLVFILLHLLPGDAADVLAADAGSATAETIAAMRERLGLDQPMLDQIVAYLGNLAEFNLGNSAKYNMPVADLIAARLPNTLLLLLVALGFALLAGIAMGWIMAAKVGEWPDHVFSIVALVLYSMPGFWIGLMAIVLFSVHLGWLPSTGAQTVGAKFTGIDFLLDRLSHLVLPAATMGAFFVAVYARLTRASMLEVMGQDYMRTAEAKGLSPALRQFRHALRNALIPITTVAGIHLGNLLGGAVVIETVYGWPGMGRLAVDAVMARDYNVLMAILLLSSIMIIIINALVDLLHSWLDPRISVS